MSKDMPRITLEMLHKLEDFEESVLAADAELREKRRNLHETFRQSKLNVSS